MATYSVCTDSYAQAKKALKLRNGKNDLIKDPHGDNPHFHLEKKNFNGEWVDAGPEHRYYFTGE